MQSDTQTDVNSLQSQTKSINCNIIDLKYTKQIENYQATYKQQLNIVKNANVTMRTMRYNEQYYKDVID